MRVVSCSSPRCVLPHCRSRGGGGASVSLAQALASYETARERGQLAPQPVCLACPSSLTCALSRASFCIAHPHFHAPCLHDRLGAGAVLLVARLLSRARSLSRARQSLVGHVYA